MHLVPAVVILMLLAGCTDAQRPAPHSVPADAATTFDAVTYVGVLTVQERGSEEIIGPGEILAAADLPPLSLVLPACQAIQEPCLRIPIAQVRFLPITTLAQESVLRRMLVDPAREPLPGPVDVIPDVIIAWYAWPLTAGDPNLRTPSVIGVPTAFLVCDTVSHAYSGAVPGRGVMIKAFMTDAERNLVTGLRAGR